MKRKILYAILASIILLNFNSCFKDEVGSELLEGTIVGEDVIHKGNADSINYRIQLTQAEVNQALEGLNERRTLGLFYATQVNVLGGRGNEGIQDHAFQSKYGMMLDDFAGYFTLTHAEYFGGKFRGSTYYRSVDFAGGPMGAFNTLQSVAAPLLNHPKIDSIPEIKALALLLYNYSAVETADCYGALAYNDLKADKQSNPFVYNSLETIYKTAVANIDTIVACIDYYHANRPDWYKSKIDEILMEYDVLSHGSNRMMKWKKLANTLKLRYAMHIVKAEPELAKKWAEEAVASGVIEAADEQFLLEPNRFSHPYLKMVEEWNDSRLNASFQSILKSYDHPFLSFYYLKNEGDIVNIKDSKKVCAKDSMIVGLRSGIKLPATGQNVTSNMKVAYSRPDMNAYKSVPLYLMRMSEVYFLRAEGAIRGWNMGGSAESFYRSGVENAYNGIGMRKSEYIFNEAGQTIGERDMIFEEMYRDFLPTYFAMDKAKDFTYVDPFNDVYTINSLTKIGVKWNDGDDNETKLEKIITQKYIANFPASFEAWTDIRRTGYPKIFPVFRDEGDGSIFPGDVIRRIPFPGMADPATQADILATGLEALGGTDTQGQRLWWDPMKSNF